MSGAQFFEIVIMTAVGLIGVTGLLGIFRKRMMWDAAERAGLWVSLEVGVMALVFALLPYPISYATANESIAWRFGSLAMVIYLAFHLGMVSLNRRRFGAQYPGLMRLLLVLSGIFLTMEFINAIWWGSLAGYSIGVLWLLALCGIQLIAFVCYDRQIFEANFTQSGVTDVVDGGVRRVIGAGHTDSTPDHHADANAHAYTQGHRLGRSTNRYTDDNAVYTHRGPVSNAPVRTHFDLVRRGNKRGSRQ